MALACSIAMAPMATTATALAAPAQQAAADTPAVGAPAWVIGTGGRSLRVRSAPGLAGERIGSLAEGTQVQVLEGPVAADELPWYRVSADGLAGPGWVTGKALSAVAAAPPGGTAAVGRPAWVAGTRGLDLRVRSAPALGSDVLGEMAAGAGVQVLEGPHAAGGVRVVPRERRPRPQRLGRRPVPVGHASRAVRTLPRPSGRLAGRDGAPTFEGTEASNR
jgi:hypothetical protein